VSPRGFITLLIVTVLAVLGAVFMALQPTMSGSDPVAGEPMFPKLSQGLAEASKVTVQTPQYTASWELRDGVWVSPERGGYPSRAGTASDLVAGVARLTKVEGKTSNPDWYQYIRVGDPAATPPTGVAHVTVATANGDVLADAVLGARSFSIPASHTRGGMYVRIPAEAQTWLVEGSAAVPAGLPEWFDTLIDIPGPEITGVTILEGDKPVLETTKTDQTTGNYEIAYLDPAVGAAGDVANSNSIRSLASGIVGLRFDDVRAIDSFAPGATARTDRFTMTSGMQLDVTLIEADGAHWATFKATAPQGSAGEAAAADITARTGKWAFRLDASRVTRLNQPVINLIQKPGATPAGAGEGEVVPVPLDQSGKPAFVPQGGSAPAPAPLPPGATVLPMF